MGLDDLPVGTILPYVGDITHLANGWHLCDGNNGTVNLIDRMPLGTANLAEAGKPLNNPARPGDPFDPTHPQTGADVGNGARVDPSPGGGLTVGVHGHSHYLPVTCLFFIQKVR